MCCPRFGWVEPLRLHGSQNVVSTRAVGSYQTTLALGGWLPVKTIRTVVTTRPSVTVCGTPFGVKMFSEGALIVGFSDVDRADGSTANPAKAAGLHLGDRVVCIGETATENNDAVKAALDAAQGAEVEVIYIRGGGTAANHPDPCLGRHGRPVAGRDVGAGFLGRGGDPDLCRRGKGRVRGVGPSHQ